MQHEVPGEGRRLHGPVQRRAAGHGRDRTARCTRNVTPEDAPEIVRSLDDRQPTARAQLRHRPRRSSRARRRSCSRTPAAIDPERIEDYIAADGYTALRRRPSPR